MGGGEAIDTDASAKRKRSRHVRTDIAQKERQAVEIEEGAYNYSNGAKLRMRQLTHTEE